MLKWEHDCYICCVKWKKDNNNTSHIQSKEHRVSACVIFLMLPGPQPLKEPVHLKVTDLSPTPSGHCGPGSCWDKCPRPPPTSPFSSWLGGKVKFICDLFYYCGLLLWSLTQVQIHTRTNTWRTHKDTQRTNKTEMCVCVCVCVCVCATLLSV